nr:hypothetical protein [Escherichia coli]
MKPVERYLDGKRYSFNVLSVTVFLNLYQL